jgi:hypothetical protein
MTTITTGLTASLLVKLYAAFLRITSFAKLLRKSAKNAGRS